MKIWPAALSLFFALAGVGCLQKNSHQVGDETDHGIVFPASAKNFQNFGDSTSWLPDRGIATLFELDENELNQFLKPLQVQERRDPLKKKGDPTVNGWNVWPKNVRTVIPANKQYRGFKNTWIGEAVPQEMLSCQSPAGDWLHVEIWELPEGNNLLKLYTDWN